MVWLKKCAKSAKSPLPALCVIRSRAADWWCGAFQVVKTAQLRGRTERSLLARWFLLSAAPLASERILRKGLAVAFVVTLPFAISES
jgi:hypothetical protein